MEQELIRVAIQVKSQIHSSKVLKATKDPYIAQLQHSANHYYKF